MPLRIYLFFLLVVIFAGQPISVFAQTAVVSNPSQCSLGIPITDNNCTSNGTIYQPEVIEITVNSTPGILGVDVYLSEVRLIVEHTWVNDLKINLLSPSGVQVELTANNGGGDDNFGNPLDTFCTEYTRFTVAGCTPIGDGEAPFLGGPYQPHDHFYLFNDNITPANGNWTLLLCDDAGGDIGELEFVELVFEPVSCLPITEVTVTNIDTTSVNLEWAPDDFCGATILEYGFPGFQPGLDSLPFAGEGVQIFDCSPVVLTGLLPDTEYELYVRRYCDETGSFSANGCPITFITGCKPPPLTIMEDFDDDATCLGNCLLYCDIDGFWKNARNDDMDWIVSSGSTPTPGTGPGADISGSGNYLYIETSGCSDNTEAVLYSSCIELDKQGTDTCHLSFNYHMFGFTVDQLTLEVSENGGFNWDVLWQKNGSQGNQWHKVFLGLGDYEDGAILQFRFTGKKSSGLKGDIAIDEIAVFGSEFYGEPEIVYYFDGDGDGYGDDGNYVLSCLETPGEGYVTLPGDCNDSDEHINPGAEEIPCDGIDNNCNIAIIDDDVILPPPPATGDIICSGEIPVLCATPVEGNFILWYDAVKTDSVVGFGECFFPDDLPPNNSPVPVEYTYLVGQTLDFNCFTQDLAEVSVIINPSPDVSTTDTPEVCPAESYNLASLNIFDANFTGGQVSFHTSSPANPGNEIFPSIVSPTETTNYYFLMTSPDGCVDEGEVTVTVKPGPNLAFTPSDSFSLCRESFETITVIPSGGTGDYEYLWSTGNSSDQLEIESSFTAGDQDVYFVTVTDEEGCFSTDSVIVTTTNSIDSVKVFVTDVSECMGSNGSIMVIPLNGTSPFNYSWVGSNGTMGVLEGVTDTAIISGLGQGGYHIEITDDSQEMCSFHLRNVIVQGPGGIIMPPSISNVSCFNAEDGEVCLNIQGNGGIEYLWSTGDTTTCVNNLDGGNYSVTITSGECETVLNDITVIEPDSLFALPSIEPPTCNNYNDGSISLSTFGGIPSYDFNWSTGDVSPYLLNKEAGTYEVTVTDFNNCIFLDTIEIVAPAPLNVVMDSIRNMSCHNIGDGYIQVTGTGGVPPYQYQWDTGSTSPVLVNLTEGVYEVTITDLNQCQSVGSFSILNPEVLEVEILDMVQPQCLGDSTGIITLGGIGGTSPYSMWADGGNLNGVELTNLAVGTYSITAMDINGCQSDTILVEMTSIATLDFGISATPPQCVGPATGVIELQPNGIAPFSYNWPSTGDTTAILNELVTGEYPVQVVDGEGCIYDTIIVLNSPQVFDLDFAVSDPSCFGVNDGIINTLFLNSGTPPFDILWNDGETDSDRVNLMPGDYQLSISDVNGCEFVSDTLFIEYPDLLQLEVEEVGLPLCNGDSTAYIETNIIGGTLPYDINWLGTGLVTEDISDLPPDDYRIIVLDANGCAIDTTFELTQPDELIPEVSILQGEDCIPAYGDTLLASATGGTLPYSFYWSNGVEGALLTGVDPGNYSLSVEDANGCIGILEDVKLGEKTGAIVLDTFMVDGISCAGESDASMTAIVSNGSGNYLYHFTPTYILHTESDTVTRENLAHSSLYGVTVTDVNSGCSVESEDVVLEAPLPLTVSRDSFDVAICFGASDGAIYISVAGGTPEYTIEWFDEEEDLVSEDEDLTNVTPGIYTAIITDENGCEVTLIDSSVVSQNTLIVNDSTIISDAMCRGDSTGIIDISVSGGAPPYEFEWSYGDVTEEDLVGAPFGSYSVTVTDTDTCRAIFPFFFIGQPTTSIELVEEELTFPTCFDEENGSIDVGFEGGGAPYTYYWNMNGELLPGEIEDHLENIGAGLYEIVLTDTFDCVETYEFEILEPELLEINLLVTPPDPPQEGSVFAEVNGGTPEYLYSWNTGGNTQEISYTDAATYSVSVEDAHGCEAMDSILIVGNELTSQPLSKLDVFPNPVNDYLNIELQLARAADVKLELLDVFGRVVRKDEIYTVKSTALQIGTGDLPQGVYLLRCSVDGQIAGFREVVVVKQE